MEDFEEAIFLTGLMFLIEPTMYPMIRKSTIVNNSYKRVAFG